MFVYFSSLDKNESGTLNFNHMMQLLSSTGADPMTKDEITDFCSFCAKSKYDEMEIDIGSMIKVLMPPQVEVDEKTKGQIDILPTLHE